MLLLSTCNLERINMFEIIPKDENLLVHSFSESFKKDEVVRTQIIRGFMEAVLFMDGQTETIKEKIAQCYALIIVSIYLKFLIKDLKMPNEGYGAPVENLIRFLEKNILQTEKLQSANYKQLLVELELKGYLGIIDTFYKKRLKLFERMFPSPDFDRNYIYDTEEELHQVVIKNYHRQKNQIFFSWPTLVIISLAFYAFINSFDEDEHPVRNTLACLVIGTLLRLAEMLHLNVKCINSFVGSLKISFEKKSESSPSSKNEPKIKSRTKKINLNSTSSDSKSELDENAFSQYKISVVPVSLFPENDKTLPVKSKSNSNKLLSSQSLLKAPEEKKAEVVISPAYFGPAFNAISSENFSKLEGCGWNKESQVYGIWCVDETKCDVNSNIESLHQTFSSGRVGTSGNCIKLLYSKYYEVRGSGAERVFGKEFTLVNGKTAIVFAYYDSDGLHDQNQNLNQRIKTNLDTIIENIEHNNLQVASSPRLQR